MVIPNKHTDIKRFHPMSIHQIKDDRIMRIFCSIKEFFKNALRSSIYLALFVIITIFWLLFYEFAIKGNNEAAQIGDAFGSLNTLFSGLAFGGVIIAIRLQGRELKLQRQEFSQLSSTAKLQRFEHSFYNMIEGFRQLSNGLTFELYPAPKRIDSGDISAKFQNLPPPLTLNGYSIFFWAWTKSYNSDRQQLESYLDGTTDYQEPLQEKIIKLSDSISFWSVDQREILSIVLENQKKFMPDDIFMELWRKETSGGYSQKIDMANRDIYAKKIRAYLNSIEGILSSHYPLNHIRHYFRYLYRLLKSVDAMHNNDKPMDLKRKGAAGQPLGDKETQMQYMGIIRAHLSDAEFMLVLLSALIPRHWKMKILIEKHQLFQNLILPPHLKSLALLYDPNAFGQDKDRRRVTS